MKELENRHLHEEKINLARENLARVRWQWGEHIQKSHKNGVIPTSCHRCLNFRTAIYGLENLIRKMEEKIDS